MECVRRRACWFPSVSFRSPAHSSQKQTCSACSTCTRPAMIQAFVDFFEKIESLEKKKPGTMAKVFSTHPPTDDRIVAAQKNIQELLKARPEYVVTTSEFTDVKSRLAMLHNKRKIDDKDSNRPQLRKAPGSGTSGGASDGANKGGSDDDRPTLKRRPDSDSQ